MGQSLIEMSFYSVIVEEYSLALKMKDVCSEVYLSIEEKYRKHFLGASTVVGLVSLNSALAAVLT